MKRSVPFVVLVTTMLAACSEPTSAPDLRADNGVATALSAMTRNTYIGADVDAVIAAIASGDPEQAQEALFEAIGTLFATDYETRMAAFADEIAAARPHVVGLQEITELFISQQVTGLSQDIEIAFLPVLEAELAARGLHYEIGAAQLNIDLTPFPGVALKDYDVVLYDASRVTWSTVVSKTFEANIPPDYVGGLLIRRGWIWGVATVDGVSYNVVSTHLESGGEGDPASPFTALRYYQIGEITTVLGSANPVIVMGDLNDLPGSAVYNVLIGAGFRDVWAALRPGEDGFTASHQYDLSNPTTQFTKRIDYVFARGLDGPGGRLQGRIYRVGEVPSDRVQGPQYLMWPSDHAGLVAEFAAPPAHGLRAD